MAQPHRSSAGRAIWLPVIIFCLLASITSCGRESEPEQSGATGARGEMTATEAWKQPQTCRECHEKEFQEWGDSHHALANRPMDPEKDAAAFSVGVAQDEAGRTFQLDVDETEGFSIREVDPDSSAADQPTKVVGVIGETPLRQILIEAARGRLQAHSLAWDPQKSEWFSVFGEEAREPGEWGHWTGQGMNWNANCASCHMTEYAKNYEVATDSYATEWTHQGISCIECHSDMETHVAEARRGEYTPNAEAARANVMDNCARCHSRREELTPNQFRPGDHYHDHYRLMLPDHPTAYFPNGQSDEENYVYGSFMFSRMGHKGVSCMDCHDPHSGQTVLPVENNALCIQCHSTGAKDATFVDPISHSGHAPGSEAAQCVTCHMPERTYMSRDPRRDHGFTLPDPFLSKRHGGPNACASCHQEEGEEWIGEGWNRLFDETDRVRAVRQRAELMEQARAGAIGDLDPYLELIAKTENPFWRAAWLRLLADQAEDERLTEVAMQALSEGEPIERDAAVFLLSRREDGPRRIAKALRDPSRLPRNSAATALNSLYHESEPAFVEWKEWLDFNSDWPQVALARAEFALREDDVELARQLIERAVAMDLISPDLRYEAAILLDRLGLPQDALRHLQVARRHRPDTGEYLYAAGLIQGEMGAFAEAAEALAAAVELEPDRHRWWYNLAIVQVRAGNVPEGIASLQEALELAPEEEAYRAFLDQISRQSR